MIYPLREGGTVPMDQQRIGHGVMQDRPLIWLLFGIALLLIGASASRPGSGSSAGMDEADTPFTGAGGTLRVYCAWRGADYTPFHRWEPATPAPIGFEPDVIARIAAELNMTVVYVAPPMGMTNPRIGMLTQGLADVVISTFSITPERSRLVAFSRPYFVDGLGAMVSANSSFQTPAELAARRLLIVGGTTGEAWVIANWPQAVLVRQVFSDERTAVVSGQVDAYLNDRSHLMRLAAGDRRVRVLPSYLTREPWGVAVARHDTSLLARIDAALATLEANGELATLQRRWLGP
jgi:ABC-type amino acid transport substrate-binding protein